MRLTLTVVDPVGGHRADAVLDADPGTAVGDLVPEFLELTGSRWTPGTPAGPPGGVGHLPGVPRPRQGAGSPVPDRPGALPPFGA
ncbi:hypothetical protein FNQ90_12260, partial [Streptomyces alkaliphilus]